MNHQVWMSYVNTAALVAFVVGLAACTDGGADSAQDHDSGSPHLDIPGECSLGCAPDIDEVTYDCSVTTPNTWTYMVRTTDWAEGGASLNIYETSAWEEGATDANADAWIELGHELSQGEEPGVDFDANREWDQWGIALAITDTPAEVAPGTELKTLFGCDLYDNDASKAGVAWRLYVYHDDDFDPSTPGVPTDCWDFGFQTQEIPLMHEADSLCTHQD